MLRGGDIDQLIECPPLPSEDLPVLSRRSGYIRHPVPAEMFVPQRC